MKLASARKRQVLARDGWRCRMPQCLHPAGRRIDPGLAGTEDLWAPTVDHKIRESDGGTSAMANLRAAHRWCNQSLAVAEDALRTGTAGVRLAARVSVQSAEALRLLRETLRWFW